MSSQFESGCENYIEKLNTSDDIKKVLRKINTVASSDNLKMKQSVKDLFLTSPSCKELSKIGKCYERIIMNNGVYPTRGSRTYLELAFPASGKDSDYREFFASPRLAAATQNYFSGVFLISFEQWTSASELIRDIAFSNLVNFIDNNKKHISFVFHVTPEFRDINQLENELAKHLNMCRIKHSLPDMNSAVLYVEKQLYEAGIELDTSAKREIKRLLAEKIDITSNSYHGYRTLEKLVSSIQFELYATVFEKKDSIRESLFRIGKDEIKAIASDIDVPYENDTFQRKLGFY